MFLYNGESGGIYCPEIIIKEWSFSISPYYRIQTQSCVEKVFTFGGFADVEGSRQQ